MVTSPIPHAVASESCDAARQSLHAEKCVLVVVDIQEKLVPAIFNREVLVTNTQLLLRLAAIIGLPVLATTQYSKGLGHTVPQIAGLLAQQPLPSRVLDKVEFGCFNNTGFCSEVRALPGQRNTVLLCGMEAHICVMQTALGALNQGYLVHVASDAVGSRSSANWQLGLDRMRAAGAVISSAEMMMYELLGGSATPAFKQMLPYLKAGA